MLIMFFPRRANPAGEGIFTMRGLKNQSAAIFGRRSERLIFYSYLATLSNSASISFEGLPVASDTATIMMQLTMNAGSSS